MKRKIKFEINFSNKIFYTFISVILLSIVGLGIYAYGTSNPAVFGHSAGELNLSGGVNGNAVFNGNVGIGTASPNSELHISSSDGNPTDLTLQSSYRTYSIGVNGYSGGRGGIGAGKFYIWDETGNAIRISIEGGNGNVGIGTSDPSQKLDVAGYVKGQSGLCIGNDCRTSWPSSLSLSCTVVLSPVAGGSAVATCPVDRVVTGGGGRIEPESQGSCFKSSYPSGNGWAYGGCGLNYQAYAICCKLA